MSKEALGFEKYPAKKRPDHITAWSFSRWNTWRKCARRAYYKIVKGLKEPSGPAAERGDLIHKNIEAVLKSKKLVVSDLHSEINTTKTRRLVQVLHQMHSFAEIELAFDSSWKRTGWFDKNTWCRIKIDVLAFKGKLAGVTDWKTGKYKPGHESYELQMELYGVGVMAGYPKVEEVETRLQFLDHNKSEVEVYTRAQFEDLKKTWEGRVQPMLDDRKFLPQPSSDCRYCPFSKANGGDCRY